MAGFEGTWECEEHLIKSNLTIGANFDIQIKLNGSQYEVTMPPLPGLPSPFSPVVQDQTLSYIWKGGVSRYGVRLVFDHAVTPAKIVAGPLCSVIERWSNEEQPEDMGTITGTKGL